MKYIDVDDEVRSVVGRNRSLSRIYLRFGFLRSSRLTLLSQVVCGN